MDEDDESESSGVVQETQDDDEVEMDLEEAGAAPRKGARKPAAGAKVKAVAVPPKKGKAAVECEGEGPSAKETRLQAKLDAVRAPAPPYQEPGELTRVFSVADHCGAREDQGRL